MPIMENNSTLAAEIAAYTITPENPIQINQISHRLKLLETWFGGLEEAEMALRGKTVLELGCGQGDMTAALAYVVSATSGSTATSGKIIAVDPAPLDYGSPYTLGDAQAALSRSKIGGCIEWVQKDPIDLPEGGKQLRVDFVVFAHSLFYLPSREYFSNLLRVLQAAVPPKTKLLLADWGMEYSVKEAEAHILAVKVQLESPDLEANVRTVLEPKEMESVITQAGWSIEKQEWIREPDVEDGSFEVNNVRRRPEVESMTQKGKEYCAEMEKAVERNQGVVKSMDVWTTVCTA